MYNITLNVADNSNCESTGRAQNTKSRSDGTADTD